MQAHAPYPRRTEPKQCLEVLRSKTGITACQPWNRRSQMLKAWLPAALHGAWGGCEDFILVIGVTACIFIKYCNVLYTHTVMYMLSFWLMMMMMMMMMIMMMIMIMMLLLMMTMMAMMTNDDSDDLQRGNFDIRLTLQKNQSTLLERGAYWASQPVFSFGSHLDAHLAGLCQVWLTISASSSEGILFQSMNGQVLQAVMSRIWLLAKNGVFIAINFWQLTHKSSWRGNLALKIACFNIVSALILGSHGVDI